MELCSKLQGQLNDKSIIDQISKGFIKKYYGARSENQEKVIGGYKILKGCGLNVFIFSIQKHDDNNWLLLLISKNYIASTFQEKTKLKRHLYEMIVNNERCLMHLDIDCPKDKLTSNEENLIIVLKKIIKNIFSLFYDININLDNDVIILKSSPNESKLSYHFLVRGEKNEYLFENNSIVGQLIKFAVNNIKNTFLKKINNPFFELNYNEQNCLFYSNNKGQYFCIIDIAIYSKNRIFRTFKSCKKGREDSFELFKTPNWVLNQDLKEILMLTLITFVRKSKVPISVLNTFLKCDTISEKKVKKETKVYSNVKLSEEYLNYIKKLIFPNSIGSIKPGNNFGYFLINIKGDKYCDIANRNHTNNNPYIIIDTANNRYWRKCGNAVCKKVKSKTNYLLFDDDFNSTFEKSLNLQ